MHVTPDTIYTLCLRLEGYFATDQLQPAARSMCSCGVPLMFPSVYTCTVGCRREAPVGAQSNITLLLCVVRPSCISHVQMQEGRSQGDKPSTKTNNMSRAKAESPRSGTPTSPAAQTISKAAARHSHADKAAMGHLQGLDASIKPAGRLLQPTVSSRIKAKGAEGYQIPEEKLTPRQKQQQKAAAATTRSNAHTTKQPYCYNYNNYTC